MGSLISGLFGGDDDDASQQSMELTNQLITQNQQYWQNYIQAALEEFPASYQQAYNTLNRTESILQQYINSAVSAYEGGLSSARQRLDDAWSTGQIYLNRGMEGQEDALSPIISAGDLARQNYMDVATGATDITETSYYKNRAQGTIEDSQAAAAAVGNLLSGGAVAELNERLAQDADSVYAMYLQGLAQPMTQGAQARTSLGAGRLQGNQALAGLYSTLAQQQAANQMSASSNIGALYGAGGNTMANINSILAQMQAQYPTSFTSAIKPSPIMSANASLMGAHTNAAGNVDSANQQQTASLGTGINELIAGALTFF